MHVDVNSCVLKRVSHGYSLQLESSSLFDYCLEEGGCCEFPMVLKSPSWAPIGDLLVGYLAR